MNRYILFMLASSNIAFADLRTDKCRYEYRTHEVTGATEEILSAYPDANGVQVCNFSSDGEAFFVLSKISEESGVSYYSSERVFRHEDEGQVSWLTSPPPEIPAFKISHVTYMSIHYEKKYGYSDSSFVLADQVNSEGFKMILNAWEKIVTDDDAREYALDGLSLFQKLQRGSRFLKRGLSEGKDFQVSKLIKVEKEQDPSFEYQLFVDDSNYVWRVDLSFSDRKLRIMNVAIGTP